MSSENGLGGQGEIARSGACSLRDLFTPGHEREGARMLARALQAGYIDIFSIDYPAAKKKATEMSNDPDKRIASAGTKLLVAMAAHDLKLLELIEPENREPIVHEHRHFVVPPPRVIGEA